MWSVNLGSDCSITPEYLQRSVYSSTALSIVYSGTVLCGWKAITLHFLPLKLIPQVLDQVVSDSKLAWNLSSSFVLSTFWYIRVSSAKGPTEQSTRLGRSSIYTKNNTGPNTKPSGTPDVTRSDSDLAPSSNTVCNRLHRNHVFSPAGSFPYQVCPSVSALAMQVVRGHRP